MMKGKKIIVDNEDDKDLEDDKKKQYSIIVEGASIINAPKK